MKSIVLFATRARSFRRRGSTRRRWYRRLQQEPRHARLAAGFAHGPGTIIREMIKLQQYSFVCAPHPFQWAGAAALDVDVSGQIEAYRRKRDLLVAGLADDYEPSLPRRILRLPKAPGHRHGVRPQSHRRASTVDHPRQRFQPPRHPFPHLLRRGRQRHRKRNRSLQKVGEEIAWGSMKILVPRLRLGTQRWRGSVSEWPEDNFVICIQHLPRFRGGRASSTARSQAEPGNE